MKPTIVLHTIVVLLCICQVICTSVSVTPLLQGGVADSVLSASVGNATVSQFKLPYGDQLRVFRQNVTGLSVTLDDSTVYSFSYSATPLSALSAFSFVNTSQLISSSVNMGVDITGNFTLGFVCPFANMKLLIEVNMILKAGGVLSDVYRFGFVKECQTAALPDTSSSDGLGLILFVILVPILFLLSLIGLFLVGFYNYKQRELNKIRSDLVIEREMLRVNMLTGLKEEFINTPAVSVIDTLRRIRKAKRLGEADLEDIDSIITVIATKKLYMFNLDFAAMNEEVIDKDAGRFLTEQITQQQNQYTVLDKVDDRDETSSQITAIQTDADVLLGDIEKGASHAEEVTFETYRRFITPEIENMVNEWEFDAKKFQEHCGGHSLIVLGLYMFEKHGLISALALDTKKLSNFLSVIESGYYSNPYHNSTHAADVLQVVSFILSKNTSLLNAMSNIERLAILFGAICHDYQHPGVNNQFLINTSDQLALTYNDAAVLEQSHAAKSFLLLRRDEYNFVKGLDNASYRQFRSTAIELILATDMSRHVDVVSDLKSRLTTNELQVSQPQPRLLLMKLTIKLADISNSSRPWEICYYWAHNVMEEFFFQGAREKERNLPVSAFMDRTTTKIPKAQMTFSEFVVKPLIETMGKALPGILPLVAVITTNITNWKAQAGETPLPNASNAKLPTASATASATGSSNPNPNAASSSNPKSPGMQPVTASVSSSQNRPVSSNSHRKAGASSSTLPGGVDN